jgi:hypothetical protein
MLPVPLMIHPFTLYTPASAAMTKQLPRFAHVAVSLLRILPASIIELIEVKHRLHALVIFIIPFYRSNILVFLSSCSEFKFF